MKNKYSKTLFLFLTFGLFTLSMIVPSLKTDAKVLQGDKCYWQECSGNTYDYFCGYEINDLHCTCGDFC